MSHGIKWDRRFLRLAHEVAQWSKDPSTRVGAVIVRPDRTIASVGYNGFPRGHDDKYADRDHKLMRTVHAELNAVLSAREPLHGYTIYVTPLCPCSNCSGAIVQAGITSVISDMEDVREEWRASFDAANEILSQAHVNLKTYPAR